MIDWSKAAAAIDAVFAEPVLYTGAGLAAPIEVGVIWLDTAAGSFEGAGATAREISCEIRKELLPDRPSKSDAVTRSGVVWRVNQVTDRDDIGRWVVGLKRA